MLDILKLILPIFLVIAAGAVLRLSRIADDSWVEVLNRYGLYIGFPSLIFLNLTGIPVQELAARTGVFALTAVLISALMLAGLAIASLLKLPRSIGNTLMVAGFFGNIAYLGYPVVMSVYPARGPETTVIIAIYVLVLFSAGIFLLEIRRHQRKSLLSIGGGIIRNPFIVAILAGALFLSAGWPVPPVAHQALDMIAASASPVVLISLGVFLGRPIPLRSIWRSTLAISLIRLFIAPAIFFGVALLLGSVGPFQVSILEAAMPLAITPFALSSMYPLDRNLTVAVIFVTTILSLFTLPLWILLLGG